MLHKDHHIILPKTFQLLQRIQEDEVFDDFFLVGGTALALQIGHRFSIDLDLFTFSSFETGSLVSYLAQQYPFQLGSISKNTVLGNIEGVKVDFITHAYPLVEDLIEQDGIRLVSILDIAAMKLNAIANSGQRLKDFIDVFYILEQYSLNQILRVYEQKYSFSNAIIPLKALTYFDDIDLGIDPPIMQDKLAVNVIKLRLLDAVNQPEKIFKN